MAFQNPLDSVIRAILERPMAIAVVGCSPDPRRDSFRVAKFLQEKGHRIYPVHPRCPKILGSRAYPSLRAIRARIDMVDVFRRPEHVPAIVEDAIAIGARILWLQIGVIHEEAAQRARDAGLTVVMDRCPAIEYGRLIG